MSQKETVAAGTLDPVFNGSGAVEFPLSGVNGTGPSAILSLPDKKLLVAMSSMRNSPAKVARLNENGGLDNTFGPGGVVDLPLLMAPERFMPNHICPLDDGGWLISGGAGFAAYQGHMAVIRLRSNGTLNTDFNETGMLVINTAEFTNSDGSVDASDCSSGPDTTAFDDIPNVVVKAAVAPDGKIILVINRGLVHLPTGVVLRLNPNGSKDTTFNQKGFLNIEIPGMPEQANHPRDVLIQPDGKVLICGEYNYFEDGHHAAFVIRYDHNGELDIQYGVGGVASFVGDGRASFYSMKPANNDGILVAGFLYDRKFSGTLVALNTSGRLSPDFNKGQPLVSDFMALSWTWLGFQADGKIVVTGLRYGASDEELYSILTARFLPDGSLDRTYGGVGWNTFNGYISNGSALTTDNRIVVSGYMGGLQSRGIIVRYLG